MQIIAVENNPCDLDVLEETARQAFPGSEVIGFADPLLAIKHCIAHPPDLIFSERDLKRLDGFALMKTLRQKFPRLKGVLLSEDSAWQRDAENLMLGFVHKPITPEKLQHKQPHVEEEQ